MVEEEEGCPRFVVPLDSRRAAASVEAAAATTAAATQDSVHGSDSLWMRTKSLDSVSHPRQSSRSQPLPPAAGFDLSSSSSIPITITPPPMEESRWRDISVARHG